MSLHESRGVIPIEAGKRYRKARIAFEWRASASKLFVYSLIAITIGTLIGYLSARTDDGEMRLSLLSTEVAQSFRSNDPSRAYYRNCAHARRSGAAPISRGQPGYRSELDADGDGVACEPFRGW